MSEMDKLDKYLAEHGYKYTRSQKKGNFGFSGLILDNEYERNQIIVYGENDERLWDAICHYGSYGYEQGLIEVMGKDVVSPDIEDEVEGWLTADDIIKRLEEKKNA